MNRMQNGFTLIELVLIIIIIGIMASVAVRSLQPAMESARQQATLAEMEQLAEAIVGDRNQAQGGMRIDFGYVGDIGALPPNLDALTSNPGGFSTWRGPYIRSSYLENPEDYESDAWGNPYQYSGGLIISSTGGGGAPLTRTLAASVTDLTANSVAGQVTDGLGTPPGDSSSSLSIEIYFPDGAGSMASATMSSSADGTFSFSNMIPVGNHLIRAIYQGNDTTSAYVSVVPGSRQYCDLKFSGSLW
jgi:prepilin-type N-terminal cleavage/methylation domain-containing protein